MIYEYEYIDLILGKYYLVFSLINFCLPVTGSSVYSHYNLQKW